MTAFCNISLMNKIGISCLSFSMLPKQFNSQSNWIGTVTKRKILVWLCHIWFFWFAVISGGLIWFVFHATLHAYSNHSKPPSGSQTWKANHIKPPQIKANWKNHMWHFQTRYFPLVCPFVCYALYHCTRLFQDTGSCYSCNDWIRLSRGVSCY